LFWIYEIKRMVRTIKPDILNAHYLTGTGYLGVLANYHPLILTPWGSDILLDPEKIIFKILAKYSLNRADLVIYNSDIQFEKLIGLGVAHDKLIKIRNGVDLDKFNPERAGEGIKSHYDIPSNSKIVISIRHLSPIYNVDMLVKAIPEVLSELPDTYFFVAGDGSEKEKLEQLSVTLGIAHNVRFIGKISNEEVPGVLAISDIYVSTSISDSSPVSLQESMACGVAPVVTDLPANREFITNGVNGFLVPVNDVIALSRNIIYLLKNDQLRYEFGAEGRKLIDNISDYNKEMDKVERLYNKMVEG
jgi:glycosyltransferase involved in cell wall biosynthesis